MNEFYIGLMCGFVVAIIGFELGIYFGTLYAFREINKNMIGKSQTEIKDVGSSKYILPTKVIYRKGE